MASKYQAYGAPLRPENDEPPFPPTSYEPNSTSTFHVKGMDDARQISRTPSPTPSEQKELDSGLVDWKALTNWRFWIRREWLWYYVIFTIIIVLSALMAIYHTQIVHWLTPVANWLHDLRFGWLVPIGILFVISFPPLFGHEIVAILCGLVWGLWIGFGIVAAGTFLGEVGNFYAFKYCCRARGEKYERTQLKYACLAKVVRDGGFKIALIARLSAIPGHFTTAVFSTCGMGIIVFSIAAILSLPKQFITVYLGVILEQSSTGESTTQSRIISDVVLAITFIITILAMWYIFHQMNLVKPAIIYERRKARQAKLDRAGSAPYGNSNAMYSSSTITFNGNMSDSDIPMTKQSSPYQQWDKEGPAAGFSNIPEQNSGPNLYAPQPRRNVGGTEYAYGGYARDEEEGGAGYEYGHSGGKGRMRVARDSTDEVGWDMGAMQKSGRSSPYDPVPDPRRASYTSDETVHEYGLPPALHPSSSSGAVPYPQSPPKNLSQSPPHPSTQVLQSPGGESQYVTFNPPASASRPQDLSPLPTPAYPSPFDDAHRASSPNPTSYYVHTQEPTDLSAGRGSSPPRRPSSTSDLR